VRLKGFSRRWVVALADAKENDMTENATTEQQQMEAAARGVAAKLQTFHAGLTPAEQQMLGLAFRAVAAAGSDEDVAGYADTDPIGPVRDWCLTWQYPWGIPKWPMPEPQPPYSASYS
jgi:hypothetical protein